MSKYELKWKIIVNTTIFRLKVVIFRKIIKNKIILIYIQKNMGGGLMQLVAYGAQDLYLTSNSQITFFKVVHRRHTNFSMESIEQTFSGTADFGKKVTVTVARNADLMSKVYLRATLPAVTASTNGFAWTEEVGHFLIKSVEVEIGGQRIDKHYGTWLSIWSSLTTTKEHEDGYNKMIGNVSDLTTTLSSGSSTEEYLLHIPLRFWFCRHIGLALPLIALQYHEVKFSIEFESAANLYSTSAADPTATPSLGDASLFVDYIYLDTDERRRFAQSPHEYLIEQLQFTGDESLSGSSNRLKLNFNHPVKELIWVVQDDNRLNSNFTDADSADGENPTSTAKLQLNGHDRFSERNGDYFNLVQPYQHHTKIPSTGINVYSFALNPEEHQPSGSANMSRIDNATLQLGLTSNSSSGTNPIAKVYAVNYNVLRIVSGMGGLNYSN
jgi:hypothetical protein